MSAVLDVLGAVCLLVGSLFSLAAAIGLVRFPDVLARMHAATKPQVLGLLLVLSGVAFTLRDWHVTVLVGLVMLLQVMTAPVSAHMVARRAYRTGQWDWGAALVDELADDLAAAGFQRRSDGFGEGVDLERWDEVAGDQSF